MADITQNDRHYNPEMTEMDETMLEKETRMMRNIFIMRSKILSIQVKVAADKIRSHVSLEGVNDTIYSTENYREKAEIEYSQNNYKEADMYILKAEQLYSKTLAQLFPANEKENEKPSEEYLNMQRDRSSSNYTGATVRGDIVDVVKCINIAKKAFAENKLEKATKWLIKSQSILGTENAQNLLDEVRAAIAARDAPTETERPEAGQDSVDINPEQRHSGSPTEPPLGPTLQYDNVEGAKTCMDRANDAFKAGKFDKAENLLLKAKKMDPSIDIEQQMKDLSCARAVVDEANAYLTVAQNAINDKNYERALTFLDKSEALNPSECSVKLRKQVEQYLKDLREARAPIKLNVDEANMYLRVAENAFNDKRYERALKFLAKSEAFNPSERAVKLRKQVQDAMSESTSMGTQNREYEKPTNESKTKELNKRQSPRVTELTEEINTEHAINRRCWYQKILDYILEKLTFLW